MKRGNKKPKSTQIKTVSRAHGSSRKSNKCPATSPTTKSCSIIHPLQSTILPIIYHKQGKTTIKNALPPPRQKAGKTPLAAGMRVPRYTGAALKELQPTPAQRKAAALDGISAHPRAAQSRCAQWATGSPPRSARQITKPCKNTIFFKKRSMQTTHSPKASKAHSLNKWARTIKEQAKWAKTWAVRYEF